MRAVVEGRYLQVIDLNQSIFAHFSSSLVTVIRQPFVHGVLGRSAIATMIRLGGLPCLYVYEGGSRTPEPPVGEKVPERR
jgi:hypothetical protein